MKPSSTRRASFGAVAAVAAAVLLGACAPPTPPAGTTTTTTTAANANRAISAGRLEWTISQEANNAAFAPGQFNFWNASTVPATSAGTYVAVDGDVTVQKKNAAGNYVNIGSEPAVSFANRGRNGAGTAVTPSGAAKLDQRIVLTGGSGTVNSSTGVATIAWEGAVTINWYGTYVPFQLINPTLTVNAAGTGTLRATATGIAKDATDPESPGTPISPRTVTLASIPNVYGSGGRTTGFTNAVTSYLNTAVTVPSGVTAQVARVPGNQAYWGSWPQSFVDFQILTGGSSYFYTSGGTIDALKPQAPVSVAYNLAP